MRLAREGKMAGVGDPLELFSVMSREVLSDLALQVLRQGLPTTVE